MSDELLNGRISRREALRVLGAGGVAVAAAQPALAPVQALAGATAKKYDGVVLKMLTQAGVSYQPALQAYAAEFNKLTGATVQFEFAAWETLMPKIQAGLAAGNAAYDVFLNDIEFQYTIYPKLLPINNLIKQFNVDMNGFFAPCYKYGSNIGGQAGVRYGIPVTSETAVIYYRKDLIPKFPTTWKAYEQVLAANTGKGKYGLAFAGVTAQLIKIFLARYWTQGVPLFTPDWQPLINSPQGVSALTTLQRQMTKYSPKGILAWDNPDASNAFLNGDVAVLEGWPDFIQDMIQDPSKSKVVNRWAIAPYPEKGTGNFTEHNVVVFKNTPNANAAFEWAAYISSPAQAKRSVLQYNVSVARKSIYSDPAVVKKYPYLPSTAAVFDRGKPFTPNVPQWLELFIDLGTGISNALAGKAAPKAALDDVASKWQKAIKQAPLSFQYHE